MIVSPLPRAKRHAPPDLPRESSVKKFRCGPCEQDFTTNRALLRHSRESKNHSATQDAPTKGFECSQCRKGFARAWGLDRHVKEQHGEGKRPCVRCGKVIRAVTPHLDSTGRQCLASCSSSTTKETLAPPATPVLQTRVTYRDAGRGDNFVDDGHTNGGTREPSTSTGIAQDESTMRAASTDDHANVLCEQMCFLDLGHQQSSDEEPFARIPNSVRRQESRLATEHKLPCGICYRELEVNDQAAFFAHLRFHFEMLSRAQHTCGLCRVAFVHEIDLMRHEQSALKGDCGFNFHHEAPCTGHHPPPSDSDSHMPSMEPVIARMVDRYKFTQRLGTWEQAQLKAYARSTDAVLRIGLPELGGCFTAREYFNVDLRMDYTPYTGSRTAGYTEPPIEHYPMPDGQRRRERKADVPPPPTPRPAERGHGLTKEIPRRLKTYLRSVTKIDL